MGVSLPPRPSEGAPLRSPRAHGLGYPPVPVHGRVVHSRLGLCLGRVAYRWGFSPGFGESGAGGRSCESLRSDRRVTDQLPHPEMRRPRSGPTVRWEGPRQERGHCQGCQEHPRPPPPSGPGASPSVGLEQPVLRSLLQRPTALGVPSTCRPGWSVLSPHDLTGDSGLVVPSPAADTGPRLVPPAATPATRQPCDACFPFARGLLCRLPSLLNQDLPPGARGGSRAHIPAWLAPERVVLAASCAGAPRAFSAKWGASGDLACTGLAFSSSHLGLQRRGHSPQGLSRKPQDGTPGRDPRSRAGSARAYVAPVPAAPGVSLAAPSRFLPSSSPVAHRWALAASRNKQDPAAG